MYLLLIAHPCLPYFPNTLISFINPFGIPTDKERYGWPWNLQVLKRHRLVSLTLQHTQAQAKQPEVAKIWSGVFLHAVGAFTLSKLFADGYNYKYMVNKILYLPLDII